MDQHERNMNNLGRDGGNEPAVASAHREMCNTENKREAVTLFHFNKHISLIS